jgi:sterol desaturase/sphingolipid hydroxylase (fatty acid hydroxylase superfamily)
MIGIPLGLAYCNFGEWFLHKYVLHGLGKNPKSFWRFHWHEHHQASRRNEMVDAQYTQPRGRWSTNAKELLGLAAIVVGHVPLFSRAPFFTATVWYSTVRYYFVHRRAHLDPQWARVHLPWHYDHHMGKDQNANWCVTHPFFDLVLGTRKEFVGAQPPLRSSEGQASVSPEGDVRAVAEAPRQSA